MRLLSSVLMLIAALSGCAAQPTAGRAVTQLDPQILYVHQGSNHIYWFGSKEQGIYRYDGTQLVQFTTQQGLAGNSIRGIQEDAAGTIFVCSDPGGVSVFDGTQFRALAAADQASSTWKLGANDLWFPGGQDTGVVYRWDGSTLHRLSFPATPEGDAHQAAFPRSKYPNATYSPYDVYIIFKDSKGSMWFGTSSLGACRYDGTSFAWAGHGENGSFGVRSIVEDRAGGFWLSNAVKRFVEAPASGAAAAAAPSFRAEPGIAKPADDFSVFMSATKDKDGNLWLATLGAGVFCYDWSTMKHFPVTHNGQSIRVFTIYCDRHNTLWLGTQEHGVYRFNGTAFEPFSP